MTAPIVQNNTIQQFNYAQDLTRAFLWQYNQAMNLQGLIEAKNTWYDQNQNQFWQDFYTNIFDINTANQFGLQIWGIILGLPLYSQSPSSNSPAFGFSSTSFNFSNGNFFQSHAQFQLPLSTQRRALKMRYYCLISSGTLPETNRALKDCFGDLGLAYVQDNHDMTINYFFDFVPTYDILYLLANYAILPEPAGVTVTYSHL